MKTLEMAEFPGDWPAIRAILDAAPTPDKWDTAAARCLDERLNRRYFDPIVAVKASRKLKGEGFLILTIQCSILEFLASLRLGWNFRPGAVWGVNDEYGKSGKLFIDFLRQQSPFSQWFTTKAKAEEFYKDIRCGLVHEAQTKNGWTVKSGQSRYPLIDFTTKEVNRDELSCAIDHYIRNYKANLRADAGLQAAFKRKFENLYQHASSAPKFRKQLPSKTS